MFEQKKDELRIDHNQDGIDRRGFLKCMAWAGTGVLCSVQGGVLKSYSLSTLLDLKRRRPGRTKLRPDRATATWDSIRLQILMSLRR